MNMTEAEYDLYRQEMRRRMLELQQSQHLATLATITVAVVVSLATTVSLLVALFK